MLFNTYKQPTVRIYAPLDTRRHSLALAPYRCNKELERPIKQAITEMLSLVFVVCHNFALQKEITTFLTFS